MKRLTLTALLILCMIPVFALQTIRGKIVDGTSNKPLDFVNVTLIRSGSDVPATGVTTDDKGDFVLPRVPNGRYTLRVTFVGYNQIDIPLNVSDRELNMGMIKLFENTKLLSEVEVVGQGTQMRFEIDKRVFSVDQNIAAAGGTATDVLQNIPSVDVDSEGNISLRNNSSVEVWINGKPSGLTADNRAQILQQMPAESIESIEIMTNPSARFNPEGTSGIINLVLKKNRRAGYFGSVSAGTMWVKDATPGGQAGLNFNYNKGPIDAYLNVGLRAMRFAGGGSTDRYFLNGVDTLSVLMQNSTSRNGYQGVFLRGGLDYRLSETHTLGLSGFGMAGSGAGTNTNNYKLTNFATGNVIRDYYRLAEGTGTRPSMNVTMDHRWQIDKLGSNMMSSLTYSSHRRGQDQNYLQMDRFSNDSSYMNQLTGGQNSEWQLKVDYTKMWSATSKLEAGWQSRIQERFSPNSATNLITGLELPAYFNEFKYNEQIHSAYTTYGTRFNDNFSVQAGLRAEYFWRQPENVIKDEQGVRSTQTLDARADLELFPSVFLSYSLPEKNELQLNVSRRVNRPRGRQINPFRDFSDSTNISYGNFDLLPEYTTVMEFNYLKLWDNHSMSSTLFHRFTDNVIQGVSYLNGNTMENTFMNVTQSQNTGFEFVLRNNFFKILNLTSSLNLFYQQLEGATYENPYNPGQFTTIPDQQNFTWNARVMGNLILSRTTFAQITGNYSAPRLIAQGRESSTYSIDLGLRQTFLDRNLSVNLMVRDLLNTRRRSTVTWGDGFYQRSESYFSQRMVGVTATYNFGNMQPRRNQRQRENGGGDLEMRFDE